MADKVQLDIVIETAESAKSIKDLRTSLKQLIDEQANVSPGSKEFKKLADAINDTEGKIGDLTDSFNTLTGSGIDRTRSSIGLLKEGFANFDFGKIGIALKGLGAAFKAIPIFLIVEGINYLVDNFKELSEGSGILAKALRFIGDIIDKLKEEIYALTDALGFTNSELDKMGEAMVANANKAKEALANQTAEYDRQISVAKASGKNSVDLEKAKQQAIIDTNKALVEQTIAYVRAGGVLNDEQKKLLTEQLNAIKNAKTQEQIITIEADKKEMEAYRKKLEEKKKLQDEVNQLILDAQAATLNEDLKNAEIARAKEISDAKIQQKRDELAAINQIELENAEVVDNSKAIQDEARRVKDLEERKKLEEQASNIAIDSATRTTNSLQALSDVFFDYKRKNLKKGSAEDVAAAKKQFNINKALGIANATIQGVQGVIAAYSSGAAIPVIGAVMGPVFAILAGVAAAANIAKISSAKFDESGGGGGGGSVSGGSGSAPSIPEPPTINTPGANTNTNTLFDSSGRNLNQQTQQQPVINVKAQVVETEMTDKQSEVKTIQNQAKF